MKKTILFAFLLSIASLNAQITITRANVIESGQKVSQATDTSTRSKSSSGPNQTWNFSNLKADSRDSLRFGMPFWYEGYENFPDANLAYKEYGNDGEVFYLKVDDTEIRTLGFYQFDDSSEGIIPFNSRLLSFPSTYNTNYNASSTFTVTEFELGIDPDSTGPIPFIDSIRVNITRTSKSNIDGWGTIITPMGTFSALKQTTLDINTQSFQMKTSGLWVTVPQFVLNQLGFPLPEADSSYNVNFWSNNQATKLPVVSYNYAPSQDSITEVTWLTSPATASSIAENSVNNIFVYPNPTQNELFISSDFASNKVVVMNFEGKIVAEASIEQNSSVSVANLPAGIYLVQIINPETNTLLKTVKIIKQ